MKHKTPDDWFHRLAVAEATGELSDKDASILERLSKLRAEAAGVAESTASWEARTIMKRLKRVTHFLDCTAVTGQVGKVSAPVPLQP